VVAEPGAVSFFSLGAIQPSGVSADGRVVVGGRENMGWMAVVPEPSFALALFALSAAVAVRRRR
jgi:hypothetical protein